MVDDNINNSCYYFSVDDISDSLSSIDQDLYTSGYDQYELKGLVNGYLDSSASQLFGSGWDAVRASLEPYTMMFDALGIARNTIRDDFRTCVILILDYLDPDRELNTSDLSKYEEELAELTKQIEDNEEICNMGYYDYDYDDENNPIENTYSYRYIYSLQDRTKASQKLEELYPHQKEVKRLIEKINRFYEEILPRINEILDSTQEKIKSISTAIELIGTSNIDLLDRYLHIILFDNGNVIFNDDGIPYKFYYSDSQILVDYTDLNNPLYYRYDEETGETRPISIFDLPNVYSEQYGASQMNFEDYFYKLINDPKIWDEMQKYFPVESFNSVDDAMEFYELYFSRLTSSGCGYAAATDFVFKSFEGKEKEFEEIFGYPMYTVGNNGNIDFNYELFMLGHFNYDTVIIKKYDDPYVIINTPTHSLYYDMLVEIYTQYNELASKLDEIKWYNPIERIITLKDINKTYDEYMRLCNQEDNYLNFSAANGDGKIGHLDQYLGTFGINLDHEFYEYLPKDFSNGIVASSNFTLKYPPGSEIYAENVGAHYMYITGYSEDGTPIVSSWGSMYYLDTSGADDVNTTQFDIMEVF